jgi:hypothetical protein
MTADAIQRAFISGKVPGRFREVSGVAPGRTSGKDLPKIVAITGLQRDSTTGAKNYGNTVTRECEARGLSHTPYVPPQDQSVEEWLDDYAGR